MPELTDSQLLRERIIVLEAILLSLTRGITIPLDRAGIPLGGLREVSPDINAFREEVIKRAVKEGIIRA